MTTIATRAQVPAVFTATQEQRRAELHTHPAPPPGLEVHAKGLRHEVQRGDSAWGIARDYSQAYHMDISPTALTQSNRAAFADGLRPGELLVVPGVQERFDAFIEASGGAAEAPFAYVVKSGDTLSAIAREASREFQRSITWQELYAANRDVIGADPNRIMPGQEIKVPGTASDGYPVPPLQTLAQLRGDVILTRVGRVRHEAGGIENIDVMHYRGDVGLAGKHTTLSAAIADSRTAAHALARPVAVVQTAEGAFNVIPLAGTEGDGLDHTDETLSLAFRANDRGVVAVAHERWDTGTVEVRRFDR